MVISPRSTVQCRDLFHQVGVMSPVLRDKKEGSKHLQGTAFSAGSQLHLPHPPGPARPFHAPSTHVGEVLCPTPAHPSPSVHPITHLRESSGQRLNASCPYICPWGAGRLNQTALQGQWSSLGRFVTVIKQKLGSSHFSVEGNAERLCTFLKASPSLSDHWALPCTISIHRNELITATCGRGEGNINQ